MEVILINRSKKRMPRTFILQWLQAVLKNRRLKSELSVVFVNSKEGRLLNRQYRGKDYATNILSFKAEEPGLLGELILCPEVLDREAKELKMSGRAWLGYMLIHGVLHLQGYDHEESKAEELRMFRIQDQLFDRLRESFQIQGLWESHQKHTIIKEN